jgi:RNA polymerase sigma-70 factor (ECF subfamily)
MDFFTFDDEYVRRLREGDRWTTEHFFRYFGELIRIKLGVRHRPRVELDDVSQETLRRVHETLKRGAVVDGQRFGSYVNSICNNVISEFNRRDHHDESLDFDVPSGDDSFADFVTEETKRRIDHALAELEKESPRDAAILRAVYLEERGRDEICAQWKIDRSYLRVLVFRALEKFRDKYGDR